MHDSTSYKTIQRAPEAARSLAFSILGRDLEDRGKAIPIRLLIDQDGDRQDCCSEGD